MNDLIERLTNGIFRQEGMPAGFNNPGNLRAAPWLSRPIIANNFWHPLTRQQGIAGAAHVVALHIARGESLVQLIGAWAPPSENDTMAYIKNIAEWSKISDIHVSLDTYLNG